MVTDLTRQAVMATRHCLTGCAIGEISGMGLSSALHLGATGAVISSIVLAFAFGYGLTLRSVLRSGVPLPRAAGVTLASDTLSITSMELTDNAVMLVVPGAVNAGLGSLLFWASLAVSLAVAFVVTVPVNRWLISRGQGHALVHNHHDM